MWYPPSLTGVLGFADPAHTKKAMLNFFHSTHLWKLFVMMLDTSLLWIHMQRDTYLSVWVMASFFWQNSYSHEVVCISHEVCPGTENYKNADTVNFMRRNITTAFKPILLRHHVRLQHPSSHFYAPSMIRFSLHYLMYFGSKLMVWHKLSHIKTLEWIC